eukprot:c25196_g1_i2 orf=173-2953(+)
MANFHASRMPLAVGGLELSRDIYGFTVRPQHLIRYRQYADIYKVEEAERSERWDHFLKTYGDESEGLSTIDCKRELGVNNEQVEGAHVHSEKKEIIDHGMLETWNDIRRSLLPVERACTKNSVRLSGALALSNSKIGPPRHDVNQSEFRELSEEDSEEEFYDAERPDVVQDGILPDLTTNSHVAASNHGLDSPKSEDLSALKQELEALVRGGVPMALRGELWQLFVGTRIRKVQGHYNALLTSLEAGGSDSDGVGGLCIKKISSGNHMLSDAGILEKWTEQIEKDLPRTFPGHPVIDEDGRNALRRLLTAYTCDNPTVGYCQAMCFFAALLLLMMPEENAFWTLTGVIDDYFEGYYSEKMVEAQVDQLVFEQLVREHFPKLVSHLDMLGVQVAWVSGPWFLSIFVNILPWESVLRVWDVLLFEGNRSMLFRTALALMELHGPAIMATKDAGNAVTLLQSPVGATFDSSQLVLVACMGYQMVDETKLQGLRTEHRSNILASLNKCSLGLRLWRNARDVITSKLYKYTADGSNVSKKIENIASGSLVKGDVPGQADSSEHMKKDVATLSHFRSESRPLLLEGKLVALNMNSLRDGIMKKEESCSTDLLEQVKWLKAELSRALEENRAVTHRAKDLESAFRELVQEDNRRLLSVKVETLELEVDRLKQCLAEKERQEQDIVHVILRMEQEQQMAEDSCHFAEQDATAQRLAAETLQRKYDDVLSALTTMEKRVVMADSTLRATLQYQALGSGRVTPSKHGVEISVGEEGLFKWPWLSMPFSLKAADPVSPSQSRKQDGGELSKKQWRQDLDMTCHLHIDDSPRKQSLLSRPFSLSWHDKRKGRQGVQDSQPLKSAFVHTSEHQSQTNSVTVSPQNNSNCSQPSIPCQVGSSDEPKASVPQDMVHLNGSIANTEATTEVSAATKWAVVDL